MRRRGADGEDAQVNATRVSRSHLGLLDLDGVRVAIERDRRPCYSSHVVRKSIAAQARQASSSSSLEYCSVLLLLAFYAFSGETLLANFWNGWLVLCLPRGSQLGW